MSHSDAKACLDAFFLANRKLQTAARLLGQSEVVGNARMLIPAFDYVRQSLNEALACLILADRAFAAARREAHIHHALPDSYEHRFHEAVPIAERLGLSERFIALADEVRRIAASHRQSPVEFVRKGTLVICSKAYALETLTQPRLEGMVTDAKKALFELYAVIRADRGLAAAMPLALRT